MGIIEHFLSQFILFSSHVLEIFGATIIVFFSIYTFFDFLRRPLQDKNEVIRLSLAKRLALGLEFKLGAEILRTVVVRTKDEIMILAAIVILRGILNYIIHWEIHDVEDRQKSHQEP